MLFTKYNEIALSKFIIPKITKEKVISMSKNIKVVIEKNGDIFYIEDVNPFGIAFTWDPELKAKADDLQELITIYTLHSCYPGFFKPSMNEVFAFIQDFKNVVAFKTEMPDQNGDVSIVAHPSGEGVIGKTTLYIKK